MSTFIARVTCQNISFNCDTEQEAEELYRAFFGNGVCPIHLQAGLTIDLDVCGHFVEEDDEVDHYFEEVN